MSNPDRTDVIAGLRALADFLESTAAPDAPTPRWIMASVSQYFGAPETPEAFLAAARAIGGEATIEDDTVEVKREFGGEVRYRLVTSAAAVLPRRSVERGEFILPPELTNSSRAPAHHAV